MFMLIRVGPYILEIKKACLVVRSPEMHLLPRFSAAEGPQSLGQKASAATSKLPLYG